MAERRVTDQEIKELKAALRSQFKAIQQNIARLREGVDGLGLDDRTNTSEKGQGGDDD